MSESIRPGRSAGVRVGRLHHRVDPTPHEPVGRDRHAAGGDGGHQVVEDPVGHVLVEATLVAVAPQVQLERLELHQRLVGHVGDAHRGEVGLPGQRAEAGELRGVTRDQVVPPGVRDWGRPGGPCWVGWA